MSETVIKVEHISKQYRLGEIGTGSLSHDLNRWWYRIRGKEDPYLKIGEVNDRTEKGSSEYVWALKDIDFEIKKGEVWGVIGKNGAGKSTLLKLLSRVTSPTTGEIRIKGKMASLLEVGTGFHGELTGRENVYLNGAILGMRKKEITAKMDEIVAFSGIEKYIDTPVKRYSSGMYVRLAFAVAAHLDTDILILDEVLAVGDASFQRKCLGKMNDVASNEGKTVLFVSHNLSQVQGLCKKGILLENGMLKTSGDINKVVHEYVLGNKTQNNIDLSNLPRVGPRTHDLQFLSLEFMQDISSLKENESLEFIATFKANNRIEEMLIGYSITDTFENLLVQCQSTGSYQHLTIDEPGIYKMHGRIRMQLRQGFYIFNIGARSNKGTLEYVPYVTNIEIVPAENQELWNVPSGGIIITDTEWKLV
jgi:lipopolysaccharide transport system ATP-binding protein